MLCYLLLILHISSVLSWDSDDLEIFDLVEEVNGNFYDVLGVSKSADASEIRRSYRRLSLQLHPDKNKQPDADVQFRQLVAVYEVLKDEKKRAKYDEVLANGLPDWRQPVYYYRRMRKMGLLELSILLSIILTTGHFVTIWSIYLEKCYIKEETYRKKRDKKGRRCRPTDTDSDGAKSHEELLEEQLSLIQRPSMRDLLPLILCRFVVEFVRCSPSLLREFVGHVKTSIMSKFNQRVMPVEKEDLTTDTCRPVRKRPNLSAETVETLPFVTSSNAPGVSCSEGDPDSMEYAGNTSQDGEWSDAEIVLLAKAVAKYPGGVPDRWHKIARMVGRSVAEVTAMSRQVKSSCSRNVDPSSQGITAAMLPTCTAVTSSHELELSAYQRDDGCLSETQSSAATDNNKTVSKTKPAVSKKVDRTLMIAQQTATSTPCTEAKNLSALKDGWSQPQQHLLEQALSQFPKGTADRWDRIAEMIPGKTKDECMQRFKYIAERVAKKKQQQLQKSESSQQSVHDVVL